MAKTGVFRSDAIKATKDGAIKSGRYYVGTTATAIENGNLVKLDSLISGERELWKVVAPGSVTASNLYIVATPELIYSEELKSTGALANYKNEAGQNITLLKLEVGDMFGISDACITQISGAEAPVVGSYVAPAATGTKWAEVATIAQNEVFYGKIVARELYKDGEYLNVIHMEKVQ